MKEKRRIKKYRQSIVNVFLTFLIILIQIVWVTYLLYRATVAYQVVNAGLSILAVFVALYVSSRDIRTSHKLSWSILMLAMPVVGIPIYFLFGRPELTFGKKKRMEQVLDYSAQFRSSDETLCEELKHVSPSAYLQSQYIANYGGYPIFREKSTKYFDSGEAAWPCLLEDLKKAEKFIFLEFFIIGEGEMWESILEILEEKVRMGVEVRVIFDDFGSAQVLPPHYERILREKGIQAIRFNPFRPFLSVIMNNRDHRKIIVIDNQISYTGGINLSDEYVNRVVRFGYWKDAAVRITGKACDSFTVLFLEMWNYANPDKRIKRLKHFKITDDFEKYLIPQKGYDFAEADADVQTKPNAQMGYVQPYGDSPLDREYVGEVVYLNMINRAHRYVYMSTPYLIISTELTIAMINAAKSGVDVRILVPEIPDKKMIYQVTKSNFRQLVNGGVKIYTYTPGFVHTKCFVADDEFATIGTINLDYRSLTLHFECGSFHYKTAAVGAVYEDLTNAFAMSKEVSKEECENKHILSRAVLMIIKLFSPIL